MILAGLVSSYREGPLLQGAIKSLLPACDFVLVLEGPIGKNERKDKEAQAPFLKEQRVSFRFGSFEDDAEKRTKLAHWAVMRKADFAVILDGDEVLLWGEYLKDFVRTAEDHGIMGGGFAIRLVELDGSTSLITSRIIKPSTIEKYLVSTNAVKLFGVEVPVSWPSIQVTHMNGFPINPHEPSNRAPLQGEPHILHRSGLRPKDRNVERQHEAEARGLGVSPGSPTGAR